MIMVRTKQDVIIKLSRVLALDVKMSCVMKRVSVPPDEHENQRFS